MNLFYLSTSGERSAMQMYSFVCCFGISFPNRESPDLSTKLMMFGIDALKSVFEVRFPPLALARNVGLDILNAVPALSNRIASVAQH